MPSKLLIVESPAKAKTLSRYLGPDYTIKASMGHIRDLPGKELAVDIEKNFKPKYTIIPSKKKTVDDLRKSAKKVEEVLLATDPDREGEAIAWHIAYLLGDAPIKRVMFNEITKKAVRDAVDNPGDIDLNKVDAQQARRVLDRLVGYLVSQQLWGVVAKGLSAGRVQSVALRLIVEREEEIEAFKPEEYWNVSGLANIEGTPPFQIKLVKMCGEDVRINNGETAKKVLAELESKAADLNEIRRRTTSQKPHPPFITSTLQQEAAKRLHMGVKRTMSVAQKLYEGIELGDGGAVGLITYMRTDSTRVSDVAINGAREFITAQYGESFLSPKPRNFTQKKKRTQDAHEAIRPTSTEWTPEKAKPYLSREQFRLYELIWNRYMATQMADAKYEGVTVDIGVGEAGTAAADIPGVKGKRPYILRAVGRKLKFAGFRRLWGEGEKEENGDDKKAEISSDLPEIFFAGSKNVPATGDSVNITEVDGEQKFTQPPARFSESMLVKTLDEKGVGRPSTYAQIISTIQDRKYVERDEKRRLAPTELGRTVNKILVSEFEDVFNVAFTAKMEEALDSVEDGNKWTDIVKKFWTPFNKRIEEFKGRKQEIKQKSMKDTGRKCPQCSEGNLVERWGRYGKFISCNRYPDCKYIEKTNGNGEKAEPEKTGKECPTCKEGELLIRQGRNGKFIGCSRYPKCRHTEPLPGEEGKKKAANLPEVNIPCPREGCGGTIVAKRTRRGKLFYSCTNWKEKSCKVAFWDMPIEKPCPECNYPLMTIKGKNLVCPECKHKEVNEEGTETK